MQGGDLSNEVGPRVAVTVDCILNRTPVVTKLLGFIPKLHEEVEYDRQMLSKFWQFSARQGYVMELVGFGYTQSDMNDFIEDLDNLGTNPFNYAKAYNVVADLVAELPYRNELKFVIDVPSRALRYGSRFYDLGRV
jgi:hypothetical protein